MPLQKQNININFAQGMDQKSDPWQIPLGKFASLENSIFTKAGLLQKRNGYPFLPALPDTSSTTLTTYNGGLTALGSSLYSFSQGSQTWVNKGTFQPVSLNTLSLIKNNANQTQCDSAVSSNGLVCVVYTNNDGAATTYRYAILDATTGQNIISPIAIPVSSGAISGSPRVFLLGSYFIIVFTNTISATAHLQYVAIPISNPTAITANADISAQYTPAATVAFDGIVVNSNLYLVWNGSDGGGAIRATYLTSTLTVATPVVFAGRVATLLTICVDTITFPNNPAIMVTIYNFGDNSAWIFSFDINLNTRFAPINLTSAGFAGGTVLNMASAIQNSVCTIYLEYSTSYSYGAALTNTMKTLQFSIAGGVISTLAVLWLSVGLASKAFAIGNSIYFLATYASPNQNTYFLMQMNYLSNALLSTKSIVSKIAYTNGGGYLALGLPSVTLNGSSYSVAYLFQDQLIPVNKTTTTSTIQQNGVYAQTGVNMVSFNLAAQNIPTAEIGSDLNLSGGFLWMFDGTQLVEQNFHLFPDNVAVTTATGAGSITAQQYWYVALYEWADNNGNIFRSAPSIPVTVTTTTASSTNTINVPTLRLTAKTLNPIKIVLYRYSVAQPIYYQVTSVTTPMLNNVTINSVAITDTLADSSIIGNSILYTTGGVVEDTGAPSATAMSLFKSRLFLVDAEDQNVLWYSKQVIEATPVEMSDLFTLYIAPTIGAQGNTGPMRALAAMDDKLIIFKKNAIYYITGNGPDNTGANNDFSEPIFITSTVGCSNPQSIAFIPQGLVFQSDKGIWLLGRDLSTTYIGAPVENFNSATVLSAQAIPATNQVRFVLNNGTILMYDYYFSQWGTFVGINSMLSATLYQNMHTLLDIYGRIYQETPNTYLDGTNPVLMSFTTGWLNLAGIQGYQRSYDFYLLGQYYSPHKLLLNFAYDYSPAASQQTIISPENYNTPYGGDPNWGFSSPFGGVSRLEQWKIHTQRQTCESVQISLQEIFDSTYQVPAGAGLTLSGIAGTIGIKRGTRPLGIAKSVG